MDEQMESSSTMTFAEISAVELKHLATGPAIKGFGAKADDTAAGRIGLCLSGGGIRSAAFSLGVLQALHVQNVLPKVDYLSTVSGGGFTGAALVAGLKRGGGAFPFAGDATTARGGLSANDVADNDTVRRLRDRSRYLMPKGVFDLVVSLGIILRGLAVNAVMVAAAVLFAAAVTLFFNPTHESLTQSFFLDLLKGTGSFSFTGRIADHLGPFLVVTKLLALLFLVWLVVWALLRSARTSGREKPDPGSMPARLTAIALIALLVVSVCELQPLILRQFVDWRLDPGAAAASYASFKGVVLGLTAGTGMLALFWRTLVGVIQAAAGNGTVRALALKALSFLALVALATALPLLIYAVYLWITVLALTGTLPAAFLSLHETFGFAACFSIPVGLLGGVFIWSALMGNLGMTLLSPQWWRSGAANARTAGACVLIVVVFLVLWFTSASIPAGVDPILFKPALALLGLAAVFAAIGGLFTENANSLHQLYRDRLNEAFSLGEENGQAYKLSALGAYEKQPANRRYVGAENTIRPLLIVNTAINIQHSEKNTRARDAEFFTMTPHHVGSEVTGYVETKTYEEEGNEPNLDLATAVAISGAAVSAAMGRAGVALIAPTLALLNIRLAFWLRNPAALEPGSPASHKDWKLPYLFLEMFKLLNEKRSKVYLSDGGHIDNLGLYQLLKRRCRLIIVSDAEADPGMTFSSFVDIERFARIDLGIRMRVPVTTVAEAAHHRREALRKNVAPAPRSPDHAHAVLGRILYPEPKGDEKAKVEEGAHAEGILLYVKASMTGNEANYLLDYERRHPAFPHESTGDQFFSEEQFEAYRALGHHAMTQALNETSGKPSADRLRKELADLLETGAPA